MYKNIKPFYINSDVAVESVKPKIDEGHNCYILPTDKFKEGSLLKDQGVLVDFIKSQLRNGYEFYLIKDESHRETSNLDSLIDDKILIEKYEEEKPDKALQTIRSKIKLEVSAISKIFNFSATPKIKADVEIKQQDAVNLNLIKDLELVDTKSTTNENDSIKELKRALDLFYKTDGIKQQYAKLLPKFNPAFMIQISNKGKAELEIDMIKKCLAEYSSDIQYAILSTDVKTQETNSKELLNANKNK
jgi:hypothetical protein